MCRIHPTGTTLDIIQLRHIPAVLTRDGIFRLYDMEIRELIDRTMLYEQHEVIRELKKHDSTI